MKLCAVSGREFRIMEDVGPDFISKAKEEFDFLWLDVDSITPQNEKLLKDVFVIGGLGGPQVDVTGDYNLLLLNYYDNYIKKEIQAYFSDRFIVTVHQGPDSVCDEVLASLNEMMLSGKPTSDRLIYGLFQGILEKDQQQLASLDNGLRGLLNQIRAGQVDLARTFAFKDNIRGLGRTVDETRSQLSDISLGAAPLQFIKDPDIFKAHYTQFAALSRGIGDLQEVSEGLMEKSISSLWRVLSGTRRIAGGLSFLSLALASAVLYLVLCPKDLFGIPSLYIFPLIVVVGLVGFLLMQRRISL
jgi:Mg2+ and Co2+ transporter CorA